MTTREEEDVALLESEIVTLESEINRLLLEQKFPPSGASSRMWREWKQEQIDDARQRVVGLRLRIRDLTTQLVLQWSVA